jgi:membrane-bound lytic murein transglycosylase A
MMHRLLAGFVAAIFVTTSAGAQPQITYTVLPFSELSGWEADDHDAALRVFLETCNDIKRTEWRVLCRFGEQQKNARGFFELFFRPLLIEDGDPAIFTGYFEPEISGSKIRQGRFQYPVYRTPPELSSGQQWYSRQVIEEQGVLDGRGLEIAWVDDPVDLFFLQIQGSGRVRLTDGTTLRLGFGAANGHTYRSPGDELVRRGVYNAHQVSAAVIRNWVRRNPVDGAALLRRSPAYVFFRELPRLASDRGPLGAMNRSLTAQRSIAVDPSLVLLGAPVWVEKAGANPFKRLMIAQDTGSAIRGAQRADIFVGTGDAAGRAAAQLSDPGRMVVLMPIQEAYARAESLYE